MKSKIGKKPSELMKQKVLYSYFLMLIIFQAQIRYFHRLGLFLYRCHLFFPDKNRQIIDLTIDLFDLAQFF